MESVKQPYSVVTTVYNDEHHVSVLLDDLCGQTELPGEIVVADGGSKDGTVNVILEYAKTARVPIRVVTRGRLNIAQGFNAAIEESKYDYVMIAAVGNRYPRDFADKLLTAITTQDVEVAYPVIRGVAKTDLGKEYEREFLADCQPGDRPRFMNHGNMIKRSLFERVGLFYECFFYAGEDHEFVMRALCHGLKSCQVKEAEVFWSVPETLSEYARQVEVYTIGLFQLCPYKYLVGVLGGAMLHFWPAFIRVLFHGTHARLQDRRRVYVMKCILVYWRYLLPDKHVDEKKVRKLKKRD